LEFGRAVCEFCNLWRLGNSVRAGESLSPFARREWSAAASIVAGRLFIAGEGVTGARPRDRRATGRACPCRKLKLEHIDGVARPKIGDERTRPVWHPSRRTGAVLAQTTWAITLLLDELELYTSEVYQKSRKDVILRQQREIVERMDRIPILNWDTRCSSPFFRATRERMKSHSPT
jgi:hypothetical protein